MPTDTHTHTHTMVTHTRTRARTQSQHNTRTLHHTAHPLHTTHATLHGTAQQSHARAHTEAPRTHVMGTGMHVWDIKHTNVLRVFTHADDPHSPLGISTNLTDTPSRPPAPTRTPWRPQMSAVLWVNGATFRHIVITILHFHRPKFRDTVSV